MSRFSVRRLAWRYVPTSVIQVWKLFFHRRSFLRSTRFFRTVVTHRPRDRDGNALPWLTYAAIQLLEDRLTPDMSVFEFGSGLSSEFFAQRVSKVVSVESDRSWFEQVSEKAPPGSVILFRQSEDNAYARSVLESDAKYDLILIDGIDRIECATSALGALTERGVIVLDDSSRPEYQPIHDLFETHGLRALPLGGLRPASSYFEDTTIFYRTENVLGL